MNQRDKFEVIRAEQARKWLNHPDRIVEDRLDRQRRDALTISQGHSLKCGLLKCHPECSKLKQS
jgi:hypothetical protein